MAGCWGRLVSALRLKSVNRWSAVVPKKPPLSETMARLCWSTKFSGFSTLQLQRAISNREPSASSAPFAAPSKRRVL